MSYASQNRIVDTLLPDPVLPDRLWLGMAEPLEGGSGEGPILVSDDAGQTWRELGHVFLEQPGWGENVRDLAICPSDPSRMAAAVRRGGIYLSQDSDESWQRVTALDNGDSGQAVAYAPLPDRCLLYASESDSASTWWTEDDGVTWSRLRKKVLIQMASNPLVPEIAYGITYNGAGDARLFELWTRCDHRPE